MECKSVITLSSSEESDVRMEKIVIRKPKKRKKEKKTLAKQGNDFIDMSPGAHELKKKNIYKKNSSKEIEILSDDVAVYSSDDIKATFQENRHKKNRKKEFIQGSDCVDKCLINKNCNSVRGLSQNGNLKENVQTSQEGMRKKHQKEKHNLLSLENVNGDVRKKSKRKKTSDRLQMAHALSDKEGLEDVLERITSEIRKHQGKNKVLLRGGETSRCVSPDFSSASSSSYVVLVMKKKRKKRKSSSLLSPCSDTSQRFVSSLQTVEARDIQLHNRHCNTGTPSDVVEECKNYLKKSSKKKSKHKDDLLQCSVAISRTEGEGSRMDSDIERECNDVNIVKKKRKHNARLQDPLSLRGVDGSDGMSIDQMQSENNMELLKKKKKKKRKHRESESMLSSFYHEAEEPMKKKTKQRNLESPDIECLAVLRSPENKESGRIMHNDQENSERNLKHTRKKKRKCKDSLLSKSDSTKSSSCSNREDFELIQVKSESMAGMNVKKKKKKKKKKFEANNLVSEVIVLSDSAENSRKNDEITQDQLISKHKTGFRKKKKPKENKISVVSPEYESRENLLGDEVGSGNQKTRKKCNYDNGEKQKKDKHLKRNELHMTECASDTEHDSKYKGGRDNNVQVTICSKNGDQGVERLTETENTDTENKNHSQKVSEVELPFPDKSDVEMENPDCVENDTALPSCSDNKGVFWEKCKKYIIDQPKQNNDFVKEVVTTASVTRKESLLNPRRKDSEIAPANIETCPIHELSSSSESVFLDTSNGEELFFKKPSGAQLDSLEDKESVEQNTDVPLKEKDDLANILSTIRVHNFVPLEQIQKMVNLQIFLSHEVPPAHMIEKKPFGKPSSKERELLNQFKINYSHFSKQENDILLTNWKQFSEEYGFKDASLFSTAGKYLDQKTRREFIQYLGQGLSTRTLNQIYSRFLNISLEFNKGPYSSKEDELIMQVVRSNHEAPFSVLSKILNRPANCINERYRRLKENVEDDKNYMRCTPEIAESIVKALTKAEKCQVEHLRNKHIAQCVWRVVGEKLKMCPKKLEGFWKRRVHYQIFAENPLSVRNIYRTIIDWLYDLQPECEREICWKDSIYLVPGSTKDFMKYYYQNIRRMFDPKYFPSFKDLVNHIYEKREIIIGSIRDAHLPRYSVNPDMSLSYISE